MKKYQVLFKETLERVIEINANNKEEALEIAEEMYKNCEVVLDYTDFSGYEISEYLKKENKKNTYQN